MLTYVSSYNCFSVIFQRNNVSFVYVKKSVYVVYIHIYICIMCMCIYIYVCIVPKRQREIGLKRNSNNVKNLNGNTVI